MCLWTVGLYVQFEEKSVCLETSVRFHPPAHIQTPSLLYLWKQNEGMRAGMGPWGHRPPC